MPIIGVVASSVKGAPGIPTIGTVTDVGTGRAFNNGAATVPFTPGAGATATSYTVKAYNDSGVYQNIFVTGASSPLTVTGLSSSTQYKYTVFASNNSGNSLESGFSNTVTATTVPQAPTIGTATGGNGSATVAYTAGATGGSAITVFTATSSPGSFSGTGASPITVTGLSNGTAYTFTVNATNANGTSAASAASNSVTPFAPATTWVTRTSNFGSAVISDAAYGNGIWIAVGYSGNLRRSTDTISWTTVNSNFLGTTTLTMASYGNGIFLAGAWGGQLRRSTDGITWNTVTTGFEASNSAIFGAAYGNSIWVVSGEQFTRRSTDLVTWTSVTPPHNIRINEIAYGNGLFVTASSNLGAMASTDGITWSTRTTNMGSTINIRTVTFGNGLWILAGDYGRVRTSTDTITWITQNSNLPTNTGQIFGSGYGNGIYVLGNTATTLNNQIRISTNAISWNTVTSNLTTAVWNVRYGNGIWVAVGSSGQIRTAAG